MFSEQLTNLLQTKSRKEIIEAVGCAQGTLSKWENGKLVPGVKYIIPLANLFSITPSELLEQLSAEEG